MVKVKKVAYYIVDRQNRRVYYIHGDDRKGQRQYGYEVWPRRKTPWKIRNSQLSFGVRKGLCYLTQEVPWVPRKWQIFHRGDAPCNCFVGKEG